MASCELSRLQPALDNEANLLGIERFPYKLMDRRGRDGPLSQLCLGFERQHPDNVRMGNAEFGKKFQSVAAWTMLGEDEIDMRVG